MYFGESVGRCPDPPWEAKRSRHGRRGADRPVRGAQSKSAQHEGGGECPSRKGKDEHPNIATESFHWYWHTYSYANREIWVIYPFVKDNYGPRWTDLSNDYTKDSIIPPLIAQGQKSTNYNMSKKHRPNCLCWFGNIYVVLYVFFKNVFFIVGLKCFKNELCPHPPPHNFFFSSASILKITQRFRSWPNISLMSFWLRKTPKSKTYNEKIKVNIELEIKINLHTVLVTRVMFYVTLPLTVSAELWLSLEEHQYALELIMGRYRKQMLQLMMAKKELDTKPVLSLHEDHAKVWQMSSKFSKSSVLWGLVYEQCSSLTHLQEVQSQVERICEMGQVMRRAVQVDDQHYCSVRERLAQLEVSLWIWLRTSRKHYRKHKLLKKLGFSFLLKRMLC